MNRLKISSIHAPALLAMLALSTGVMAAQRYRVVDLGPVGGAPAQPYAMTNNGLVSGAAVSDSGALHAVLWYNQHKVDIGAPGLGGPNSLATGVNASGILVGAAQTQDPNDEDFCGLNAYGLPSSATTCLPFFWRNGSMRALPTLGGANGFASMVNSRNEIAGYAETDAPESGCPVSQFQPVLWKNGKPHALPLVAGDSDGMAAWINDKGQVVGASGACAPFNPNSELYLTENHAVLWDQGQAIDLGNLGGDGAGAGNHACSINNRGQIVGHSDLTNDVTFHAFLRTRENLMQDLGTLEGDSASLALGINDEAKIVGASLDADFNPRAYVLKNAVMTDLNTLVNKDAGLYLLLAYSINDLGEIAGFGAGSDGKLHGFLAVPSRHERDDSAVESDPDATMARPMLSPGARLQLRKELAHRHYIGRWR